MEKKKKTTAKSGLTFEKALEELEEITARLEDGSLGLDKSILEFEKGAALVKFCREKLEEAERKIEILQKGEGGNKVKKKQVKIKEDTGEIDDKEDLQGSLL